MSQVGQCIVAPDGYRNLIRDRPYFYLGRPDANSFVNLCFFDSVPNAFLERLSADDFEYGLENQCLLLVESPPYPPWIAPYIAADASPASTAMTLQNFLEKNKSRAETRLRLILPLLAQVGEILRARDPVRHINTYAKTHVPELNQARTRLHLFSYLCFGCSLISLLPNTWKNGRWDRAKSKTNKKPGRKSVHSGAGAGWPKNQLNQESCIAGFLEHTRVGLTYDTIYKVVMRESLGCKTRKINGKTEIYQPNGEPFPSFSQFMTILKGKFTQADLDVRRYGKNRSRTKQRQSAGSFTEHCLNLMERIEADVYYVRALTKGVVAEAMPPMCVARLICSTSGMRLGLGASLNGERASAYAMALFSMGMPKDEFCRLFGLDIERHRWPSGGLPMSLIVDRGPGAAKSLVEKAMEFIPHLEMAPSDSGQSKALVESTHPRHTKLEGRPLFEISNLNYLDWFKKEIIETVESNWVSDASGRMNAELYDARVMPRPVYIWNFLDSRLRTDAVNVPEGQLIRAFLNKTACRIDRAGAWLPSVRFQSDALAKTRLCEKLPSGRSFNMPAYMLDLCLRQMWIDHKGDLIKVYMDPSWKGGDGDLDYTIEDLERITSIRRGLEREAEAQDTAISMEYTALFEEQTGLSLRPARTTAKRPKRRTRAALDELATIKSLFGGS